MNYGHRVAGIGFVTCYRVAPRNSFCDTDPDALAAELPEISRPPGRIRTCGLRGQCPDGSSTGFEPVTFVFYSSWFTARFLRPLGPTRPCRQRIIVRACFFFPPVSTSFTTSRCKIVGKAGIEPANGRFPYRSISHFRFCLESLIRFELT